MMLSDASKREQYIANLGDSRFCIISADDGRLKWSTEDHTLTTEKDYIESHGGEIRRGTTGDPGIFLKNGSKESMGRAVPRAFGNAHLKRHGADGKICPMNNVPTIYVRKLESNEIYLLFTDGYPVLVGDWDINIQSHWCDILNLGSEKFKEAYKWECKEDPSLLGCKCIKSNFDVH